MKKFIIKNKLEKGVNNDKKINNGPLNSMNIINPVTKLV